MQATEMRCIVNQSQMLKGLLEGCVLKIIDEGACYSGEIVRFLKEKGFPHISEGTHFPLLLRLENQGFFFIERKNNPLGPCRKYYSLNEKGKNELQSFIAEWNTLSQKIDFILKGTEES